MKDHLKENVKRMRQIQRSCKEKEREHEVHKPMKALWQSDKYREVPSKIRSDFEKEPLPPRPNSAPFLRAHSRSGPSVKDESRPCTPDPSHKLSVPPASFAQEVKMMHHDIDFIKHNGQTMKSHRMMRSPSLTALDDLKKKKEDELRNHPRGDVPKYLRNRQTQWKKDEEDRVLNTPDPAAPPGHRMMAENERQDTISILRRNEKDLVQQLQELPLRMDTLRLRTKRNEIEGKLTEIEEAMKIFARPKVFIKVDQ